MVEDLEVVLQGITDLIVTEESQIGTGLRKVVVPLRKAIHPVAMENHKILVVFCPAVQQSQLPLIKI